MKALGYVFAALAVMCLISILNGGYHQIVMFIPSALMAWAIFSEEKRRAVEEKKKEETETEEKDNES